uniref:Uncharacterized protein n=1 Tax=Anguilla anguilla TaxID=7936 RepID=A0A0E9U4M8_ANGAN
MLLGQDFRLLYFISVTLSTAYGPAIYTAKYEEAPFRLHTSLKRTLTAFQCSAFFLLCVKNFMGTPTIQDIHITWVLVHSLKEAGPAQW